MRPHTHFRLAHTLTLILGTSGRAFPAGADISPEGCQPLFDDVIPLG